MQRRGRVQQHLVCQFALRRQICGESKFASDFSVVIGTFQRLRNAFARIEVAQFEEGELEALLGLCIRFQLKNSATEEIQHFIP